MKTTARTTKEGKRYEVLVDLDEALKIRKSQGNINSAVLTNDVFHNLKSGEKASESDLIKNFGTSNFEEVAEKIIKSGEIVMPTEYLRQEQDQRYKQVVDFLVKNSVSPQGRPYTPDRIMTALKEAKVNVKNKPIDSQIKEIIDQLSKILPIKIEIKKIKILIPAQHTGKAYNLITDFKQQENWHSNGDLEVIVNIPSGLIMDFYDKLNSVTHGSSLTEEMKN